VLGAALTAQEQFGEAERVLNEALARDRGAGDQLAAARDLAQLADADFRQKRYAAALPLIEQAAAVDQDRLAPAHPLIAEDLDTIGRIYLETDRAADAAQILRAAVGLLERGPGGNTPTLAYLDLDLARAEHALGREEQSQALFKAAQHILNASQDEERDRQRQS
jgi:tetratricopeptide (TPR) repeat protein